MEMIGQLHALAASSPVLNDALGGPQSRVGHCEEETNLPLPVIEPRLSSPYLVAINYITSNDRITGEL
jgi:hypothetical protein